MLESRITGDGAVDHFDRFAARLFCYPHHITQRDNNREPVFFDDEDRSAYLEYLNFFTQKYQVDIWAYCLMTNHVH